MPSFSGQKGITCIKPTAPAEETAQRSKRLSTLIRPMTRPGARARLTRQARANEIERIVEGKLAALGLAAMAVLQLARLDPPLAHHHAMRNPEQLRIRELDAGAGVAVVIKGFDAGGVAGLV